MITKLEYNVEPSIWNDIPQGEKFLLELQAANNPVFFWNHPKMGNFPLFESKIDIMNQLYSFGEDGLREMSELIFASGMRGGKTAMAGLTSLTETYRLLMMKDPQQFYKLAPSTEIFNINTANSLDQAKDTVFRKVKEIVSNSPYFAAQEPYLTATSMKFPKHITFRALGSNLGSNVGRTVKSFVADEIDDYDDPEETYDKLSKSTQNFEAWNENVRVMIGSPGDPGGFLLTRLERARAEKWKRTITVWKATWDLNPNIEHDEEARRRNPIAYDRDFGANPTSKRENLFNFVKLQDIQKASEPRTNLFMGQPDWRDKWNFTPTLDYSLLKVAPDANYYILGLDPSVKNDGFGISLGYLSTDDKVKIVGSTILTAARGDEIKTADAEALITPICKVLPIKMMVFDIYMHSQLHDIARDNGANVYQHNLDLGDWIMTRNDLYDGQAEVPYSEFLFKEYRELMVLNGKKVDHPRSGSKDQADSTGQVISYIRREQEEARLKSNQVTSNYVIRF